METTIFGHTVPINDMDHAERLHAIAAIIEEESGTDALEQWIYSGAPGAIALDYVNDVKPFAITDAASLPGGAVGVLPAQQEPSNIGWVLMPDADRATIAGIGVRVATAAEFLNVDGKCFAGNDEFNSYINQHA